MSPTETWKNFYQATRESPPSALLVEAMEFVRNKGTALDVGCGALKDSRFLVHEGFDVVAIDAEPAVANEIHDIPADRFHFTQTTFEDFSYDVEKFDCINAMYSLPFIAPHAFNDVFRAITSALKHDGIFCGVFFGNNDEWNANPDMTFHTKADVEASFSDMEVLAFKEKEFDGTTALKTPKHWHTFQVIARRKS